MNGLDEVSKGLRETVIPFFSDFVRLCPKRARHPTPSKFPNVCQAARGAASPFLMELWNQLQWVKVETTGRKGTGAV